MEDHTNNNTAKFTIDFLTVKNLADGNEVYLEWGKGPGNRTKTVTVVNGVADFAGESVQQEIEMKRDKKFLEYWARRGIEIKLVHSGKQSMFNKSKNNVAVMRIDFGRLTECFKTDFVRNFDIWASNEFVVSIININIITLINYIHIFTIKYREIAYLHQRFTIRCPALGLIQNT